MQPAKGSKLPGRKWDDFVHDIDRGGAGTREKSRKKSVAPKRQAETAATQKDDNKQRQWVDTMMLAEKEYEAKKAIFLMDQ